MGRSLDQASICSSLDLPVTSYLHFQEKCEGLSSFSSSGCSANPETKHESFHTAAPGPETQQDIISVTIMQGDPTCGDQEHARCPQPTCAHRSSGTGEHHS